MVRKGILTPFYKLKGFERRLQDPAQSSRSNTSEEVNRSDDIESSSVARVAQSMSEAAKARPTTKVLDPTAVPKLDAPTRPFRRLKKPFKIPPSQEGDTGKSKVSRKRRPLPGKKWRKMISREENDLEDSGTLNLDLICWFNQ